MTSEDFKPIEKQLKDEAIQLALTTFENYKKEAKADALKLIEEMKQNLEKWTLQLADGELSKADFEFLVLGQKELIEMIALKQAGLAKIKLDEFKIGLLNLIIKTIIGLI